MWGELILRFIVVLIHFLFPTRNGLPTSCGLKDVEIDHVEDLFGPNDFDDPIFFQKLYALNEGISVGTTRKILDGFNTWIGCLSLCVAVDQDRRKDSVTRVRKGG
ncbi:MAG: hypothetical protein RIT04_433 [Candidatus Parcubacteria bacterium]